MTDDTQLGGGGGEAADDVALDARRDDLQAEAGHLLTQLDDLHVGDPSENHDENFADSGQVAAEQGESMALAVQLREQLDDVQRALDKLDAGTYGQCEACGDAHRVGPARGDAGHPVLHRARRLSTAVARLGHLSRRFFGSLRPGGPKAARTGVGD